MRFVELFAGIGLFRLGLEALGPQWECVLANDFSSMKADAYSLNFERTDLLQCDVAEVGTQHIPEGTELVTASFPCQDLSLAGNRAGLAGSRSGNFHEFTRIITELAHESRQPAAVVLENVVGLLTSHQGADIRTILVALSELGYGVDLLLLDASHWLPQSRPRIFIVGRLDFGQHLEFLNFPIAHQARPKQIERVVAANSDIKWSFLELAALPITRSNDLTDLVTAEAAWWFEGVELERELSYIRSGSLARLQAAQVNTIKDGQIRHLAGYRRMRDNLVCLELRDDGMAGCLRTATGGSSRQLIVEVTPEQTRIRYMMPREYARLMGVPDTFNIPINTREALHGFGDAVAVPVITWLGAVLAAQALPVPAPAPALAPVA